MTRNLANVIRVALSDRVDWIEEAIAAADGVACDTDDEEAQLAAVLPVILATLTSRAANMAKNTAQLERENDAQEALNAAIARAQAMADRDIKH